MPKKEHLNETRETMWLNVLPKGMSIAELGVFVGAFSWEIFKNADPQVLYLVDIWNNENRPTGAVGEAVTCYKNLLHHYNSVHNIHVWRGDTVEFLKTIGQIDCIYLDSDHGYEQTTRELEACRGVVTRYITGHDYDPMFGVPRAVDEFCDKHGYDLKLTKEETGLTGMPKSFIICVDS